MQESVKKILWYYISGRKKDENWSHFHSNRIIEASWSFQISASYFSYQKPRLQGLSSFIPALLVGREDERSLHGYILKVTYLGNEKSSQSLGPAIQMNANKEKRDEIEDDENKNHEQHL